ncbi:MAG TPA: hypothetical protein VE975_01530 [Actinomycetota bacterium]|nr:hypothetical protein [Actinomycetota bacterium]
MSTPSLADGTVDPEADWEADEELIMEQLSSHRAHIARARAALAAERARRLHPFHGSMPLLTRASVS